MADTDGFAEFVALRSLRLLRTAYLLTHDHGLAEDLVQTALARAWLAWPRINGDAEPYVRRTMVNTYYLRHILRHRVGYGSAGGDPFRAP